MSSETPNGPWLIGGPGRCGKTHLAETLWEHAGPVAGFPLEGLFTVYSKRWLYGSRQMREDLVEEYVARPRYIDADRKKTEKPAQYFKSTPTQLRQSLPSNRRHPVAIIGWILDCFASENECRTWAAFDLHPEFRYTFFRKHIPGAKLAVMVRDPHEAIAAALFWRGNPGTGVERDVRFKHSLIMYCLAVRVARALARRWPQDVRIFDLNALCDGHDAELASLSSTFGIAPAIARRSFDFTPHFQLDERKEFLLPDGERATLLTSTERAEISVLTNLDGQIGSRARTGFLLTARFILVLADISPGLARGAGNITYYPLRTVTRLINSARRLILDLRRLPKSFRTANGRTG